MSLYDNKIIIACSTPPGINSGLGIIRISGFNSILDFQVFFKKKLDNIKPRFNYFTELSLNSITIDQITFTYFEGPFSYTGENLLELYVHGNQLNIQRIIRMFVEHEDIREAYHGEFTYRALVNKKINTSQVEGLDLLLNSNSLSVFDLGLNSLKGELIKSYENLNSSFLKIKSSIEMQIDFSDDIGEEQANKLLSSSVADFNLKLSSLYRRASSPKSSLIDPDIVLLGLPNAGKSTLFNYLLDKNRSIVSSIKGTTRDYVSEFITIDDVTFNLIDTAGIRESSDEIEIIGIEKSKELMRDSFFNIFLINPFDDSFDMEAFSEIHSKTDLIIFTHFDCEGFEEALIKGFANLSFKCDMAILENGPIEPMKNGPIEPMKNGPIEPIKSGPIEPIKNGPIEPIKNGPIEPDIIKFIFGHKLYGYESRMFKLKGRNIPVVSTALLEAYLGFSYNKLFLNKPILLTRQRELISRAYHQFEKFTITLDSTPDIGVISAELEILSGVISELLGVIPSDAILNNIFDNFCIGK